VELGREAIALGLERGSGLFLGLDCSFCGYSTTLQVRLSFYREEPWSWVNLPPSPLLVPSGGSLDFQASLAVPSDAAPGAYQGALHLTLPGFTQNVPVLVNVAVPSENFEFGATPTTGQPYENARLGGGFDWRWRYESGDWRVFYFTVPPGSADPNSRLVVDTRWNSLYTDVDSWVFGAAADPYSSADPDFYGPAGMQSSGGSSDTYINNGRFLRETSTGYAREVVGAGLREGLGMLVLHNVLYGGDQLSEPYSASLYRVQVSPSPTDLLTSPLLLDPPRLSGTTDFQFLSGGDIPDGLRLQAYGFSPRIVLTGQPILQDSTYNICAGSWMYRDPTGGPLAVRGGQLEISIDAVQPASSDLDLYLFEDDGSGRFECGSDTLRYYSNAAGSLDRIKINFPLDANYWLMVQGYNVPGGSGSFDITIRNVNGGDLRLRDLPFGPVQAGIPVDFEALYNTAYDFAEPTTLDGVLFVGLPGVPDLFDIPVTLRPDVLLWPAPRLWFDTPSLYDQPAGLSLALTNLGALEETIQVTLSLPPELAFHGALPGGLSYDPGTHSLLWNGPLAGGESALLQAKVSAAPGTYSGPVTVSGQVFGLTSGQIRPVSADILVRQSRSFLPAIRR
jgi:hypothetical protein